MQNCKPVVIFQTYLRMGAAANSKAHFSTLLSCFEPHQHNLFLEPSFFPYFTSPIEACALLVRWAFVFIIVYTSFA